MKQHHEIKHACTLPVKDEAGLPRIPPNAGWWKRNLRNFRRLALVSSKHFMCKKLFRNQSAIVAERKRQALEHPLIIHPLSRISQLIQAVFALTWLYSLVTVPVKIYMPVAMMKMLMHIDIVFINILQLICITSFFVTGYIDWKTNQVILEPKRIIRRYLRTFCVFDALSVNCFTKIVRELNAHGVALEEEDDLYYVTFATIVIRVIALSTRINTLLDSFNSSLANLWFSRNFRATIVYTLKTFLYLHMLSFFNCSIPLLIYYKRGFPEDSWLTKADLLGSHNIFQKYSDVFTVTACHFFGVSHQYLISEPIEQICVIAVTIFGRLYTLFLLADILRLFGIAGVSESTYEKQVMSLKEYLISRDIPEDVTQRMVKYCNFKFQGHYFREDKILQTLSGNLRMELFLFTARKLVERVKFFHKLPSGTLSDIIECMKSEIYSPGDLIVRMDSELDYIYFISTGTAAVINDHGVELCHLEDGDEFGLGSFLIQKQTYCVVALETTEVFTIEKKHLMHFLIPYREVMVGFYKTAKSTMERWKKLDERAVVGEVDLMTQLRSGKILEKFTRRVIAH